MITRFYDNGEGKQVHSCSNFGGTLELNDYVQMGSQVAQIVEIRTITNSRGKEEHFFVEFQKDPMIKMRIWLWRNSII